MFETQEQIKQYIFSNRKITILQINTYIKKTELDKHKVGCPRCHSENWNIFDLYWEVPLSYSGSFLDNLFALSDVQLAKLEAYYPTKTKIECNICGYIIHDPNAKFWDRFLRFWKR